jgi:hypothetical protein
MIEIIACLGFRLSLINSVRPISTGLPSFPSNVTMHCGSDLERRSASFNPLEIHTRLSRRVRLEPKGWNACLHSMYSFRREEGVFDIPRCKDVQTPFWAPGPGPARPPTAADSNGPGSQLASELQKAAARWETRIDSKSETQREAADSGWGERESVKAQAAAAAPARGTALAVT